MQKLQDDGYIYRLPPDKRHPKGLRVRRSKVQDSPLGDTLVATVNDGRMFYTKRTLTREKA